MGVTQETEIGTGAGAVEGAGADPARAVGSELRADLHGYLRDAFLQLRPTLRLADTDRLLDLGVLDSLAFVELVEEVQNRYGVAVRDVDITEENFGSVAAIAAYVESRRAT